MPSPSPSSPAPGSGRRLGLFGGSFDPVHKGHLAAARAAQEAFGLDRVIFVPAARPPHKPDLELAPQKDRLEMLQRAIASEPSWCVCDLEFNRPGLSYTMDTVEELRAEVGEDEDASIWLLIGADNLPGLVGWHRVEELLEAVRPVVIRRAGEDEELPPELAQRLSAGALELLRAGLLAVPPVPGRSTDLRAALRAGEGTLQDLPEAVGEYIRKRGLYGAL
ncbi:MAG: nicotinate-nucleotide adenylyltransferase [Planctomycetota bacterium]|nr:nicotinate-nucleotide adenylyltransferase [Planctomycetota bacterium]